MDRGEPSSGLRVWDVALVVGVAALVIAMLAARKGMPTAPSYDALIYVGHALGLAEFGVFGSFQKLGLTPLPSYEVTPLYPAFVALLAKVDPALRESLICTIEHGGPAASCPNNYLTVVMAQGALMVVFAASVWLTTWLFSRRRAAAWLALFAVLACSVPLYFARMLLTEALFLPLFGLFTLVLLLAMQQRGQIVWPLLAGVLLGLLALTRPTFAYVFWLMLVVGIIVALLRRQGSAMRAGLIVFTAAYAAVVLPWIARNQIEFGRSVFSDPAYAGRTLSQRAAYNRMTAAEWGVAFLYWFPDVGDQLAKRLFPRSTYERLDWSKKSLYQIGVRDIASERPEAAAGKEEHLSYVLRTKVLANPVKHFLVSLPLGWRAMFIDKYWGILGWICCVWLLWRTARRREWSYWILCLPPFFLLAFHAAVSVSIPRYSIPLIPVLSLAIGVALLQLCVNLAPLKFRLMPMPKSG